MMTLVSMMTIFLGVHDDVMPIGLGPALHRSRFRLARQITMTHEPIFQVQVMPLMLLHRG